MLADPGSFSCYDDGRRMVGGWWVCRPQAAGADGGCGRDTDQLIDSLIDRLAGQCGCSKGFSWSRVRSHARPGE